MRGRLEDIASWQFGLLAALVTVVAAGIVALALGLGADEEGIPDGAVTVRQQPPAADGAAIGRGSGTDSGTRRPTPAAEVVALAESMSVPQRVAQLFLVGFRGTDLAAPLFAELRQRPYGGVAIDAHNYVTPDQLAALAGEVGLIAEQEGTVAPWVLAPQEGGEFNAFSDLPPALAAADVRSAAQAFDEAGAAAAALADAGLNGVLGPVVDVAPPDGRALGARAYSDDPREVAAYARAVVGASRSASFLSAPAHFPGLGAGAEDTRYAPSQVASDLDDLRARDLLPFRAAIRAGAPAITMSHGLYVTDDFVTPGSLSRTLIALLRSELGFRGLVITDDLADPGVTALATIPEAAVRAVRAGADLLYVSGPPAEQRAAYDAVLAAVRRGTIRPARLREAVLRNLSIKRNYRLLD